MQNIIESTFDIFLFSETKIGNSFPNSQFSINGYRISQDVQKITENYCPCLLCLLIYFYIYINWSSLVTSWVVVQKIYSKMYLVSCTNTHRDVAYLVNHGMIKNTKTWMSWEQNIIFLWNKEIINLCLRSHILRSYCFVAKVTFKAFSYFKNNKMVSEMVLQMVFVPNLYTVKTYIYI